MHTPKLRVIKDYDKLSDELKEQIKLVYPEGYSQHLIRFTNSQGQKISALRFETFEKIFLIRMSVWLAEELIDKDPDYDEDGNLKSLRREKYEDEYSDIEYLPENENYDENW